MSPERCALRGGEGLGTQRGQGWCPHTEVRSCRYLEPALPARGKHMAACLPGSLPAAPLLLGSWGCAAQMGAPQASGTGSAHLGWAASMSCTLWGGERWHWWREGMDGMEECPGVSHPPQKQPVLCPGPWRPPLSPMPVPARDEHPLSRGSLDQGTFTGTCKPGLGRGHRCQSIPGLARLEAGQVLGPLCRLWESSQAGKCCCELPG